MLVDPLCVRGRRRCDGPTALLEALINVRRDRAEQDAPAAFDRALRNARRERLVLGRRELERRKLQRGRRGLDGSDVFFSEPSGLRQFDTVEATIDNQGCRDIGFPRNRTRHQSSPWNQKRPNRASGELTRQESAANAVTKYKF